MYAVNDQQGKWRTQNHKEDVGKILVLNIRKDFSVVHQSWAEFPLSNIIELILKKFNQIRNRLRPPPWSSGQSSWLQIQRSGLDFRRYQILSEVADLERGPLSLVSTIEEPLERKSGSGLEIREYGRRRPLRWPRGTLYPQKFALTSPTSGGRSVGIVRLRTKATGYYYYYPNVLSYVTLVVFHLHLFVFYSCSIHYVF
jgi:hypothetical protein